MRVPSTPRRTGARSKPVHFSYVSTERGQPYEAYLAGPVWWGPLHMLRPSKPCVYELTGGQVACRFCGAGKARVAVVKGWVPLYRRIGGDAVCVPVDEVQRDHLDALKCFTKVVVGREKGKGVGVYVRAAMNQEPEWSSTLPEYSTPADITISLLNMWALDEVRTFFCGQSDNAVSLVASEEIQARPAKKEEEKVPAVKPYREPEEGDVAEALGAVFNRIKGKVGAADGRASAAAKDAERNGSHKPSGEGGGL